MMMRTGWMGEAASVGVGGVLAVAGVGGGVGGPEAARDDAVTAAWGSGGEGAFAVDLLVSFATVEEPSAEPGDRIQIEFRLFNAGTTDAEDVVAGYYLSTDSVLSDDDVLIDSEETSDIDAGDDEDESEQVTVPDFPAGEAFVLVVVDPFDAIAETDETNNVGAAPIEITGGAVACNEADLAAPLGQLTFADITAYIDQFNAGDEGADLAEPFGELTFADITAFVTVFAAGCP